MTQAGAIMSLAGIVSTALFGRFLPVNQWIGASKCVPVCSPNVTLFQYQAGPRPSYREISWMRTGAAWPNSGGSTMTGKSGLSVKVRSTTRTAPEEIAPASSRRLLLCIVTSSGLVEIPMSPVELALERFRIGRETLPDLFGDISDIHLLEPASSPDTIACAIARGATFGGGTVWNHSVSTGPVNKFITLTPPGLSSARRQCESDRHAACEAE